MYAVKGIYSGIRKRGSIFFGRKFNNMSTLGDRYTVLADDKYIQKPLLDDRKYRFIKLDKNNLHVLLISDAHADKAAASLDVHVGSFTDKKYNISGLAHFCEHLLFMGTEKYPEENEYSSYLSKHSGYSNAYTAPENTNYYFELSSDYLEGALDRFAQFFICPLFSKSCQDREIKAVDSENKKNLQNDLWRFYQLDKSTSNSDHPYNGFSTGNYETLHTAPTENNLDVRDILIDFHRNNYSSNLMSLVVLGKEDLMTLTNWTVEKFSDIPNKDLSRPNYGNKLIYEPKNLKKIIKAKPIMDTHKLEINFMIPSDQEENWDCRPSVYFSHLIGHESKGSIFYFLKQKGWVNDLSAGGVKVCQGSSIFSIELDLTPSGLDNWDVIVVNVFQYLNLIISQGPQRWVWNEISKMTEINFKFRQKQRASSTVSKMSSTLYKFTEDFYISPEQLLSSSVLQSFNEKKITEYGSYLKPENLRIILAAQNLDGMDSKEKWYGTEYSYADISADLISKLSSAGHNADFHLPEKNDLIPENFGISKQKTDNVLKHPYLLEDNEKFQFWFKQDDQFEVPKATIEMILHLPQSNDICKHSVYTSVICEMIEDELNEFVYYASLVGLHFKITQWRDGILIKVSGYNDKLPLFLSDVLRKVLAFEPRKDRFEVIQFKLKQNYKNFFYEVPYSQIGNQFLTLVNDRAYPHDDRIEVLDQSVSFETVSEFLKNNLWSHGLFGECLIQGNFDIDNALKITKNIKEIFEDFKPMKESKEEIRSQISLRTHILPKTTRYRYEQNIKDQSNINSCIEYFIQIDPTATDTRLEVLTDLLSTIIHEPCFNQLRTKEQLGYVVFSGTRLLRTNFGFRVLIQSERTTDYLEFRIEEFLKKFGEHINNDLTEESFQKFKISLHDKKAAKLKNLDEEVSRFWNAILTGFFDFQKNERHIEVLREITREEFVKFYNEYILSELTSARLIVHLKSQSPPVFEGKNLIHASILNYCYRNNIPLSSDAVDKLIEGYDSLPSLAAAIVSHLTKSESFNVLDKESLKDDLLATLKQDSKSIVPSIYPSGKLLLSQQEFKSSNPLRDPPEPIVPLSTFYYSNFKDDQAHL